MAAKHKLVLLAVANFAISAAIAQTQVDMRTQSRNIDFTASLSTKPIRTGAGLPVTCSVGEAYFLTSATPGQNFNLCVTTNNWVAQGQGGVASGPQGEIGLAVTRIDGVTLAIGANCSLTTPCNARVGGTTYTYFGGSTLSLTAGTPTVRIYVSDGSDNAPSGTVKVRTTTPTGVVCSGGCTVEISQTSFPGVSIPLAIWTATTPIVWDLTSLDLRSGLSTNPVPVAGGGILITQGAVTSIAVDTTVIPRKFGGAGVPGSIAASSRGDFYSDTVSNDTYQCFNIGACTVV